LQSLSHDAGGIYIRANDTDEDIELFIRALQSFEKEELVEQKMSRYEDQYPYFLIVSFIAFALEWLL